MSASLNCVVNLFATDNFLRTTELSTELSRDADYYDLDIADKLKMNFKLPKYVYVEWDGKQPVFYLVSIQEAADIKQEIAAHSSDNKKACGVFNLDDPFYWDYATKTKSLQSKILKNDQYQEGIILLNTIFGKKNTFSEKDQNMWGRSYQNVTVDEETILKKYKLHNLNIHEILQRLVHKSDIHQIEFALNNDAIEFAIVKLSRIFDSKHSSIPKLINTLAEKLKESSVDLDPTIIKIGIDLESDLHDMEDNLQSDFDLNQLTHALTKKIAYSRVNLKPEILKDGINLLNRLVRNNLERNNLESIDKSITQMVEALADKLKEYNIKESDINLNQRIIDLAIALISCLSRNHKSAKKWVEIVTHKIIESHANLNPKTIDSAIRNIKTHFSQPWAKECVAKIKPSIYKKRGK